MFDYIRSFWLFPKTYWYIKQHIQGSITRTKGRRNVIWWNWLYDCSTILSFWNYPYYADDMAVGCISSKSDITVMAARCSQFDEIRPGLSQNIYDFCMCHILRVWIKHLYQNTRVQENQKEIKRQFNLSHNQIQRHSLK